MIELKSAICPECGGLLRLNSAQTQGTCKSCGTTILISGAPGIKQEIAAWILANQQLEDGNADKAAKYFQKVIELNPEFGEAYYGCFECAIYSAEYYLSLNHFMARCKADYVDSINEAITKYGKRAVQYAPDEDAASIYNARIQEIETRKDEVSGLNKKRSGFFGRFFG